MNIGVLSKDRQIDKKIIPCKKNKKNYVNVEITQSIT